MKAKSCVVVDTRNGAIRIDGDVTYIFNVAKNCWEEIKVCDASGTPVSRIGGINEDPK